MKKIKNHTFCHGDILDGSIDRLMEFSYKECNLQKSKFDIMYCDPPWGIGALKMFDTLNAKMNNVDKKRVNREDSWESFVFCFADMINKWSHNESIVLIEMGLRFSDYFKTVIESNTNFKLQQTFNTKYKGSGKYPPLEIMYFSFKNNLIFVPDFINDTHGWETVDQIARQCIYANQVVLDPCCGFGRTLKATHKYGGIFRGNEINAKRLDKAIKYAEEKI